MTDDTDLGHGTSYSVGSHWLHPSRLEDCTPGQCAAMTQAIHMVARLRRSFSNRRLYLSSEVALILGGHRFARGGWRSFIYATSAPCTRVQMITDGKFKGRKPLILAMLRFYVLDIERTAPTRRELNTDSDPRRNQPRRGSFYLRESIQTCIRLSYFPKRNLRDLN